MSKKRILVLCICTALCLMLCSCGKQSGRQAAANTPNYTVNESYNPVSLLSVTGKPIDVGVSDFFDDFSINRGWAISYAGRFLEFFDSFNYGEGAMWNTYQIIYYYPETIADRYALAWELEDEAEYQAAWYEVRKDADKIASPFIVFGYIDSEDDTNIAEVENLIKDMDTIDFGTIDGNRYFMAFIKEMPQSEMYTPEDLENMREILDSKEDLLDNFALFPPVYDNVNFSEFSALDADGNTLTQAVFADYDVTMINIWATWCDGCLEEMDELGKLYNMLPDGSNLISFCASDDGTPDSVQETIDQYQIPFTVILPDEELKARCLPNLPGYPTSVFVDKNGKAIGRMYAGAPTWEKDKVADTYKAFIEDLLSAPERL